MTEATKRCRNCGSKCRLFLQVPALYRRKLVYTDFYEPTSSSSRSGSTGLATPCDKGSGKTSVIEGLNNKWLWFVRCMERPQLLHVRVGAANKVIAWVSIVMYSLAALGSWATGAGWISLAFLGFAFLGVVLLTTVETVEVDAEKIRYARRVARYEMKWDDVKRIETDAQRNALVFEGDNQRLAMMGFGHWSGSDKEEAIKLIQQQAEQRHIAIEQTPKALWRTPRNTKTL